MYRLIQELKRRKVFRALAAYGVVCWIVLQIADVVSEPLALPLWVFRALIIAASLGLPIVVVISWFFNLHHWGLVAATEKKRHRIGFLPIVLSTLATLGVSTLIALQWDTPAKLAEPGVTSLAVLPFELNPGETRGHLNRLSNELIERLRSNPEVRVASDDAVAALGSTEARTQAEQLGVGYIFTGAITESGDKLDLEVSLYDNEAEEITWEQTFRNAQLNVVNPLVVGELLTVLGLPIDSRPPHTSNALAYDLYLQGLAYMSVDAQDPMVEELLQTAISEDPRFSLPHAALCRTYVNRFRGNDSPGTFETAEKHCYRALTLDDQSAEVHYAIGELMRGSGQLEKARDSYKAVLAIDPHDFKAKLALAESYYRSDDPIQAERTFQDLIRDNPGSPNAYHSLCIFYFNIGRYPEAADAARWAVRLAPTRDASKYMLGISLFMSGEFTEAEDLMTQMLEDGTKISASVQNSLATVYFFSGNFEKAAELYRITLEQTPDSPYKSRNLADALYHLEGREGSRPIFEMVIEVSTAYLKINPDEQDALNSLVVAYGSLGDKVKLENYVEQALAATGGDPQTHYDCAVAYARLGEAETARIYIENALDMGYSEALVRADPDLAMLVDD